MERSNYPSEIPIYQIAGGIHPAEHKIETSNKPVKQMALPPKLSINLKGQAGNRSIASVEVGDKVLKGQVIAIGDGTFSAYQHAPSSGVITAIDKAAITHPSGLEDLCIEISTDGEEKWCTLKPKANYQQLSREQILAHIFESGIVGLGGASFPSHIKLQREQGINTLIINAAECEPYITCDDLLLQEKASQVLVGAKIISQLYQQLQIIIGIEDNKPRAIEALKLARQQLADDSIKIAVVPTKYPSGGEKQLIQLITGQQVPVGKFPAELGIIMHNVATCYAIEQAFIEGKPLLSRLVTLTGSGCQDKNNFEVLLGTPIRFLLEQTNSLDYKKIIIGGPMMGFELSNIEAGIIKSTNCIIIDQKELSKQEPALACIRCSECMDACPASLLPQQLYWHAKSDEFDKAEEQNLFDCIECGACAYVCPSNIPLVQYYRYAKSTIRNQRVEKLKSEQAKERYEARLERLERVKREKAERHKKAAEARRQAALAAGKNDTKKAAVAAALARVKAKKAASQAEPTTKAISKKDQLQ